MPVEKNTVIRIAVFICGAVVMIFEIVGSRVIAPHIGTSTYTWTSLIGVILAALSLGYWLGGRWADEKPRLSVLSAVIFLSGGMIALTVLIKEPFLASISNLGFPLEITSILAAAVLFAPASVFLGFVAPYAARLTISDIENSGKTVGSLYALSTIGSILGTFLAGFVLIPFVGSSRTLYFLAAAVFCTSFALAPFSLQRYKTLMLAIFVLGIGFEELTRLGMSRSFNYHDFDTRYNRVRIFDTRKNGRPLRAMAIDPKIYQSSMYLDDGAPGASYIRYYHLIRHFRPGFSNSLVIGGAGYSFPKDYLEQYPKANIDVVEIDPGMTDAARLYFDLKPDSRLHIFHVDGRAYLNRVAKNKYDAVFVDAFNSLFSIPFHLTTIEAVRKIEESLRPGGIVFLNFASAVNGDGAAFLESEAATYRNVFLNVELFRVSPETDPERIQNVILVASNFPLDTKSGLPAVESLLRNRITSRTPLRPVLTDDLAPVERFISIAKGSEN